MAAAIQRRSPIQVLRAIEELQRRFFVGDAVVILAGVHQGATGSVLSGEDGILNLLTGDDGTYVTMLVKMYQQQLY